MCTYVQDFLLSMGVSEFDLWSYSEVKKKRYWIQLVQLDKVRSHERSTVLVQLFQGNHDNLSTDVKSGSVNIIVKSFATHIEGLLSLSLAETERRMNEFYLKRVMTMVAAWAWVTFCHFWSWEETGRIGQKEGKETKDSKGGGGVGKSCLIVTDYRLCCLFYSCRYCCISHFAF